MKYMKNKNNDLEELLYTLQNCISEIDTLIHELNNGEHNDKRYRKTVKPIPTVRREDRITSKRSTFWLDKLLNIEQD